MTTETQAHPRPVAIVVCSRCPWAYFGGDLPQGLQVPGPIIALQEHWAARHQRCPYCGSVMDGRVCRRCDARSEDSPLQAGEGAPGGGLTAPALAALDGVFYQPEGEPAVPMTRTELRKWATEQKANSRDGWTAWLAFVIVELLNEGDMWRGIATADSGELMAKAELTA